MNNGDDKKKVSLWKKVDRVVRYGLTWAFYIQYFLSYFLIILPKSSNVKDF